MLNGLLAYRPLLESLPRAGIVHRLDKDTSGLLVVACSSLAYKNLTKMIAIKALQRRYHAVCEGKLVSGFDVDRPIGRDPKNRTKQVVSESGKQAFTEIRVMQRYSSHSLVQAELKTGRTHQIRVHLSSLGHPLVGDSKYGARRILPKGIDKESSNVVREFKRQALHSASLGFEHPITGEPKRFSARWPRDFRKLVEVLGGKRRDMGLIEANWGLGARVFCGSTIIGSSKSLRDSNYCLNNERAADEEIVIANRNRLKKFNRCLAHSLDEANTWQACG
ncbi:MAG: hypothetical protein Ct9H90mP27_5790 [Gammaproteobacteria bacterium]|nr:MAG: hypothetical protein Ct9H90mP27_5790 [Gammaproteobacteria bacterium]